MSPQRRKKEVVPPPARGRLVRRSLDAMNSSVIAGRYRVLGAIGTGGMGSVYEAVDLQTGCEVALKALQPGAYDTRQLKRLRREAATATTVRSDYVCQVHYLGVERGTPFIVMERLHGETLRARLREGEPLSPHESVALACQLLDALSDTHEAGVVHRDVKPSNIFLTPRQDGLRLKLIDFGLAKVIRTDGTEGDKSCKEEITSTEHIAGTLHYLAPEQLLALGDIDARADVYAAGVTIFEMLTGHRAYGGSYAEIVHDIVLEEPPLVSQYRSDLPELFDDVLSMAMAKTRERRFASAQAFKRALLWAWEATMVHMESGVRPALDRSQLEAEDDSSDRNPTLRPPPMVYDSPQDEMPTLRPPPSAAVPSFPVLDFSDEEGAPRASRTVRGGRKSK